MATNENIISFCEKNAKMGAIPSVSLPPIITCPHWELCKNSKGRHICYALKDYKRFPNMHKAYDRNLKILTEDRQSYFEQIRCRAKLSNYFRWHVSGDIVDLDYLDNMNKIARQCKNTKFLAFTKSYEIVNEYYNTHKKPRNLQVVLSLPFDGMQVDNPHNLPTAAVILKGQEPNKNQKVCGGNCSECACQGVGCWELKKGETIAFYEH